MLGSRISKKMYRRHFGEERERENHDEREDEKDATTTDVTPPAVSFDRATGDDAPTGQGPSDFALQLAALYAERGVKNDEEIARGRPHVAAPWSRRTRECRRANDRRRACATPRGTRVSLRRRRTSSKTLENVALVDVILSRVDVDTVEIQGTMEEITARKCEEAAKMLLSCDDSDHGHLRETLDADFGAGNGGDFLLVEDVSLGIDALNGFPALTVNPCSKRSRPRDCGT